MIRDESARSVTVTGDDPKILSMNLEVITMGITVFEEMVQLVI